MTDMYCPLDGVKMVEKDRPEPHMVHYICPLCAKVWWGDFNEFHTKLEDSGLKADILGINKGKECFCPAKKDVLVEASKKKLKREYQTVWTQSDLVQYLKCLRCFKVYEFNGYMHTVKFVMVDDQDQEKSLKKLEGINWLEETGFWCSEKEEEKIADFFRPLLKKISSFEYNLNGFKCVVVAGKSSADKFKRQLDSMGIKYLIFPVAGLGDLLAYEWIKYGNLLFVK